MNSEYLDVVYGEHCQKRVIPELRHGYERTVERLWTMLPDASGEAPSVNVVHSPLARPLTRVSASGIALAYDQYLGQIFNKLTRMALGNAAPQLVTSYLLKLFAQRTMLIGRLDTAGLLARASLSMRPQGPEFKYDNSSLLLERAQLVKAQEDFAIGHELMHVITHNIDRLGEFEELHLDVIARNTSHRAEVLKRDHELAANDPDSRRAQVEADRIAALRRANMLDPSKHNTDRETFDDFTSEEWASLVARRDVVHESICDLHSALTSGMVSIMEGRNPVQTLAGATLALQHLRLIQMLDLWAEQASAGRVLDAWHQSVARVSLLRTGIRAWMPALGFSEEQTSNFHAEAIRLNRLHSTVIMDHALFAIDLGSLGDRLTNDPGLEADAAEFRHDRRGLRALLGFRIPDANFRAVKLPF